MLLELAIELLLGAIEELLGTGATEELLGTTDELLGTCATEELDDIDGCEELWIVELDDSTAMLDDSTTLLLMLLDEPVLSPTQADRATDAVPKIKRRQ